MGLKRSRSFLLAVFILISALIMPAQAEIRYVAIGDSYSIGTGTAVQSAWPALLAERLRQEGINITLVANPGRGGWTTLNAMEWQIPVLQKANADFVTVMIGVNDWLQGYPPERFRINFADLLNDVLLVVGDHRKVLVVNIPDFSVTVKGAGFTPGRNIPKGIKVFNKIIAQEAKKREVAVVDIFPISQNMGLDPSLVAKDLLHPSEQGHRAFFDVIFPAAKEILGQL